MKIDLIAGARPNFIKIASIIHAIKQAQAQKLDIQFRLIHTGQHFDRNMSDSFFEQLNLPEPDVNLGAGGGTQAEQTAKIMMGYEKLLLEETTDLCLVVGDVTSTMACAIVAKKLQIKVAHVEAGIRSHDMSMPEEVNRLLTDSISDYFFTTSEVANENLRKSGISDDRIFFVGNTMIDTLLLNQARFIKPDVWDQHHLEKGKYLVMTLHRPANVDEESKLKELIDQIVIHSNQLPLIFPVHPRTKQILNRLEVNYNSLIQIDPMSYLEFNYLVKHAKAVITDSGGITEETTMMGVPCMTLRNNTERPETISLGTNELLGVNPKAIAPALEKLFRGDWKKGGIPPLWDGKTGERIIQKLIQLVVA
ncbi:UDP-N-acetylglucosamine 2-epimerase (non-hydrolyzing) [Aquirufa nivalisilvae]|uniref:non-hydrolyzing UDP-N-acetylglucosamine 2-epimerase n=1 Tax=Aquirufa nivalisilvae TaxID=2516557 RepID=UPI0022A9A248|nr:UDP-N-acetylglucosamine 2-epimerase (non-hydrolyzing) [Aquirufa nivalisilvae]MCZ2481774.1 UDP-N-acetylglucosamine 2-epimerase (non-hydrolyzing) [Aquirufa nivalisilvae]